MGKKWQAETPEQWQMCKGKERRKRKPWDTPNASKKTDAHAPLHRHFVLFFHVCVSAGRKSKTPPPMLAYAPFSFACPPPAHLSPLPPQSEQICLVYSLHCHKNWSELFPTYQRTHIYRFWTSPLLISYILVHESWVCVFVRLFSSSSLLLFLLLWPSGWFMVVVCFCRPVCVYVRGWVK